MMLADLAQLPDEALVVIAQDPAKPDAVRAAAGAVLMARHQLRTEGAAPGQLATAHPSGQGRGDG